MSVYDEVKARILSRVRYARAALDDAEAQLENPRTTAENIFYANQAVQEAVEHLTGQNDGGER